MILYNISISTVDACHHETPRGLLSLPLLDLYSS